MNRDRDYPTVNLLRLRLLQFRKEPTGLGIRPKGREPEPPPEVVHDNETVIPAISPKYSACARKECTVARTSDGT